MRKETKKAPTIRFRGFSDDWEQRKLGELMVKGGSGGTPAASKEEYYNGNIPFLAISDIKDRDIKSTAKKIAKAGLNNSAAWIVPHGAISLAMYASVGKVGILSIDSATSQAFFNMVFDEETLRNYVFYRLVKADFEHEWEPLISTGTQRNLNAQKVKNFEVFCPAEAEMGKVSKFLWNLDDLITLHQRKLDQLKQVKKYFLQNMFPAKGEKAPRIRFKGFTGDWEQHKLGECLALITYGFTNPMEDTEDGPWKVTAKDIVDGKINYSSTRHTSIQSFLKLTDKSKPKKDDVLLTKDGTLGRTAIVKNENICINQSVALLRCNDSLIPEYLTILLNSPKCKTKMLNDAGGGTIKHIYITKVDKMFVDVPSLKEQKFVARFFINMDHHITLHQHKLDQLQTMKKFMLQNMFI